MRGGGGLFVLVLIGLGLVLALVLAWGSLTDKATSYEQARGNAEAAIIRAHGQASLDRAEAAAIRAEATTARLFAALPWGVLVVVGLSSFGLLGLSAVVVVVALRRPADIPPARQIETHVIYLPPVDASRRELFQWLAMQLEQERRLSPGERRR